MSYFSWCWESSRSITVSSQLLWENWELMMILTELKLLKLFLILSKDIHHCSYNVLSLRHKNHCKWDELMKFDRELCFLHKTESCQSFHVPVSFNSWKLKLVHLEQSKNKYLSHKKTSICVLYSWVIKITVISSPMTAMWISSLRNCSSLLIHTWVPYSISKTGNLTFWINFWKIMEEELLV